MLQSRVERRATATEHNHPHTLPSARIFPCQVSGTQTSTTNTRPFKDPKTQNDVNGDECDVKCFKDIKCKTDYYKKI